MRKEKLSRNSNNFMIQQDEYMVAFRTNVEVYAKDNNLTLKGISELSNLSFATLNSFLYGNTKDCKLSTAIKLSKAFGVSIDELVGAGTIPEQTQKSLNIVRQLPKRSRYLLRWIIKYQQKLLMENKRNKIISIMIPKNRNNQGMFYSDKYTSTDISSCSKEIKSKVFIGIKIAGEDYMPKYMPGDILLVADDSTGMDYDDYVIVYYEKIYIVKRKSVNGKIKYYSILDRLFDIYEDEIDMKIGYVAEVLYDEEDS